MHFSKYSLKHSKLDKWDKWRSYLFQFQKIVATVQCFDHEFISLCIFAHHKLKKVTNIWLLSNLKLLWSFTCKEYLVVKLCPEKSKIHPSDFSGLPLVLDLTFCLRVPITRKFKLLVLEDPGQACYSSTLEEMDYNCVVTKCAYCYFENFIFQ